MRFQFKSQTGPYPYKKYGDTTTSLEYFGQSTTTTLSVYNPKKQSGRMTLGVLQNFTKKFCFGVEMLAEWNRGSFNSQMALASRYTGKDFSVAATVSKEAFDLSYWCQIHTNQQLGSSLIINSRTSKAIGSFFYQLEYRDAVIRGMVDSNWSLGFTYTKLVFH